MYIYIYIYVCIQNLSVYSINGLWVYLIQPSFKLHKNKGCMECTDAWSLQFKCIHGVVGPTSLVEGQHAWSCKV